ncbi:histidine phosphatase family protein [Candidatus Uhrbacteria bacterium]|nr:histidine phosphatase family protein [Candidatus Uhrbacteria bacterium]
MTGAQDVELTHRGVEQARQVGRELDHEYPTAFASALRRSRDTLRLAMEAGSVVVGKVRWDERLNERGLGKLELQPSRFEPAYAAGDLKYAPEGGESYEAVARRTLSFLIDLTDLVKESPAETILICGHMGPLRILVGILDDAEDPVVVLARSFPNAEMMRLRLHQVSIPPFLEDLARVGRQAPVRAVAIVAG